MIPAAVQSPTQQRAIALCSVLALVGLALVGLALMSLAGVLVHNHHTWALVFGFLGGEAWGAAGVFFFQELSK